MPLREASERVHTASITYAVRDTRFDGRDIHEGDIMGLVDNRISALGSDVAEVSMEVLAGMVTDDTELITVYFGHEVDAQSAQALKDAVEARFPHCDVELHDGGQPLYYYLIAVE